MHFKNVYSGSLNFKFYNYIQKNKHSGIICGFVAILFNVCF